MTCNYSETGSGIVLLRLGLGLGIVLLRLVLLRLRLGVTGDAQRSLAQMKTLCACVLFTGNVLGARSACRATWIRVPSTVPR